jgi:membrane protein DedA with SNARE-associated domain
MATIGAILIALIFAAIAGMTLFFFVGPLLAGRFASNVDRRIENRHSHRRKLAQDGKE